MHAAALCILMADMWLDAYCRQMLAAVYRFVGASFHAAPSALGELILARALMQALASPFGGLMQAHSFFWIALST